MNTNNSEFFVGSIQTRIRDEIQNLSFPVLIQYPTLHSPQPTLFGPYSMDVSVDAEIADGRFPLIVISHGNGGSHLVYRTISACLAKNGYIVAMPEHFGNNRNDNSLENTIANLVNRPKHISLTVDSILSDPKFNKWIQSDKIAVIGHSMGGYTALALAGGIPWTQEAEKVEVSSDARIKAIVLMAPGAGWFMNSLSQVTIPILLYSAEHDPITPSWNADIVRNGVSDPAQVTYRFVSNAGHFSFLSPFPDSMKNPNFRPSTDPDGFDREKFHRELPKEILEFLNEKL
ncbi:alpha/beta fold hydrolase [Leptospira kmetyi]|uniref:Alpha/beta fold hydrolase n=1 Tax=Leptospira kmetyi TaxID=408139 RepID=A0AAD0XRU9_9LEPT|nr:alpha/beta fold hydrolase [Leptospira kmetyi]AYV57757.1 alpha/beta fold hydrolase [Leptospira kmetyi]